MTIQRCTIRAIVLVILFMMICSIGGAVKIQTERQYPGNAVNPGSSPAAVGTAVFHNSTTADLKAPYKTNSWLSPILWADSKTMFYRGSGDINKGEKHPLYQLPVYPLPWSLYYCKTTYEEEVINFHGDFLNRIDPDSEGSKEVLQGLFVRPMPIYSRYDTQLYNPQGEPSNDKNRNMYALYGTYTAPAIHLDPGFNSSHIRISRMGDYDAGFTLASSDDPNRPAALSADAKFSLDAVRGSPYLHLTAEKIPSLNLTIWSGQGAPGSQGTVLVNNVNISYVMFTKPMKSYGPDTGSGPEITDTNQTYVIFYPTGSAGYSETALDPIIAKKGLKWYRTAASFTFSAQTGPNYLTMTSVPSPDVMDTTTLQTLAAGAFRYPTGSTVSYGYDRAKAVVTATYTLNTNDVLKTGGSPVQGLLPLHYGKFFGGDSVLTSTSDWVKTGSGTPLVMDSVLGEIHFLKGSSFTCTYRYPGVLPYIPGLPSQDPEGQATLSKYLKIWESEYALGDKADYKYTLMNLDKGIDTYNAVQVLWRAANTFRTAQGVEPAISKDAASSVEKSISLFFADKPELITKVKDGQAPYYSYYDPNASSVLLYPAGVLPLWPPNDERYLQWDGYGTVTKLNDHHYTYGYFIGAAAEVALNNATWMETHKDVINQMVFDVAYDPSMQSKARFSFPKMRLWDAYSGHCEAGGMTYPFYDGNNDESISEEMQFWYSVILWGTASGQSDIESLGIAHYTQAVYSYYTFWRDSFGNYQNLWNKIKGTDFDPLWVSKDYIPQIWDSKVKQSTFFGSGPVAVSAITVLPMTGGSFYNAMNSAWIESYITKYFAYIKKWDMDPLNPNGKAWNEPWNGDKKTGNPWSAEASYYGELACWYALVHPEEALNKFLYLLNPDTAGEPSQYGTKPIDLFSRTEKGVPEAYHFIRFLQDYGTPEPLYAYATNTPYSMTFVKNSSRTYVGFNPTGSKMDITFSDGKVIKSVAAHEFGFWPAGLPLPVKASFTATPSSGNPPLAVTFKDTSNGSITDWAWTFGDGSASTEQNPVHTYPNVGTYQVNLTVTDTGLKTSSTTHTVSVISSGTLPGKFSLINLSVNNPGKYDGYPSLVIGGNNTAYLSYFSADTAKPWQTGKTKGSIRFEKIGLNQGQMQILTDESVADMTYKNYVVDQPEWGRSSIALDKNSDTPLIAYLNLGDNYPQQLHLSWKNAGSWNDNMIGNPFPWTPSLAMSTKGKPGVGIPSGTRKQPLYLYKDAGDWKAKGDWAVVGIGTMGDEKTFNSVDWFFSLFYTGSEQIPTLVYYNSPSQEIRLAYTPDKNDQTKWTIEPIQTGVSTGQVSAAYDAERDILGVSWYDLSGKTLKYMEKPLSGTWGPVEKVDTSGNDTGSNCTLAFGPKSGAVPGPGISYYDTTARQLRFAWKDTSGWHTTVVDANGAGTSNSLAYSQEGYPQIAYRHEGSNSLKYAYLNQQKESEGSFTSDVRSGGVPLTVRFFDTTVNDTISSLRAQSGDVEVDVDVHYWWDLNGDGEWDVQDVWNPVYTYTETGTYDVKLLLHVVIYNKYDNKTDVVDFWGVADYDDYITVTSPQPMAADFEATPVSGSPPLTVSFTDTSSGSPTSWIWNFGDGARSADQNPVHTYSGVGKYTVTLQSSGEPGSSVVRKPTYITVDGSLSRGQAGMLRVRSDPSGADVYLDGVLKGITPADELLTKTGSHTLLLHLDGYQNWSTTTEVPAGEVRIIPTIRLRKV